MKTYAIVVISDANSNVANTLKHIGQPTSIGNIDVLDRTILNGGKIEANKYHLNAKNHKDAIDMLIEIVNDTNYRPRHEMIKPLVKSEDCFTYTDKLKAGFTMIEYRPNSTRQTPKPSPDIKYDIVLLQQVDLETVEFSTKDVARILSDRMGKVYEDSLAAKQIKGF